MAITRGTATGAATGVSSETSRVVNTPGSLVDGTYLFAVVNLRGTASTDYPITAPAGWTLIIGSFDVGSPNVRQNLYQRIVTTAGSEPATHTWTSTNGLPEYFTATIIPYFGVDLVNPVIDFSQNVMGSTSTTRTTPPIVIPGADTDNRVISAFTDRSGSTWTLPDTAVDTRVTGNSSTSHGVADSNGPVTPSGSVTRSATASVSSSVGVQGIVALRAASTATPVADSDTSAGTDDTQTLSATISDSETGAGTDTGFVAAPSADADSGTATDSAVVGLAATEDIDGTDSATGLVKTGQPPNRIERFGLSVDFDNDGDFSGPYDSVVGDFLRRSDVSIRYGRDQIRSLSPVAPGEADAEISNVDGLYSIESASSPLHNIYPIGLESQIYARYNEQNRTLFTGYVQDWKQNIAGTSQSVSLSLQDMLGAWGDTHVSTAVFTAVRSGDAINTILDRIGWPSDKRDVDPGGSVFPFWWAEGTAFEMLMQVQAAEGPPALCTVSTDGDFIYRDRHHRLYRARSLTSQALFTSGASEVKWKRDSLEYEVGWGDVINQVKITCNVRRRAPRAVVWEQDGNIIIPASTTRRITVASSDPFQAAVTPVEGTDYAVLQGSVSMSLFRVSGITTSLDITAAAGNDAVISNLQVRADPLVIANTVEVEANDTQYQNRGIRTHTPEIPFIGPYDAEAIAQLILNQRSRRNPTVRFTIEAVNAERINEMLNRDLSDRIHVQDSATGLDGDFFIEEISHTITNHGAMMQTTFGCEMASMYADNVFTFNDAAAGFNLGQFGHSGDTPSKMFTFNDPARGFNNGQFGY